jgi:hypothetical protein
MHRGHLENAISIELQKTHDNQQKNLDFQIKGITRIASSLPSLSYVYFQLDIIEIA